MPGLEKSTCSYTSGSMNSLKQSSWGGFAFFFFFKIDLATTQLAKIILPIAGKACRAEPENSQAALQHPLQRVLPRSTEHAEIPSHPGRKRTDKETGQSCLASQAMARLSGRRNTPSIPQGSFWPRLRDRAEKWR